MIQNTGGISGSCPTGQAPAGLDASRCDPGRKDFTVADVLAWARTKPADGYYDYTDSSNCALCLFLRESGRAASPVVAPSIYFANEWHPIPAGINDAVRGTDHTQPRYVRWSFGELVKRLEKLCPETPVTPSDWLTIDAYMADIEQVTA